MNKSIPILILTQMVFKSQLYNKCSAYWFTCSKQKGDQYVFLFT